MTIRLEGISKRFGTVRVVRGLDLEIAEGEFFTLLGGSGSGKTTLLRLIAGLDRPDTGRILINGQVVSDTGTGIFIPPERRGLGMVFQSYALWPHLSVHGNLVLGLEERRLPRSAIKEREAATLARVGLAGLNRRYPHQLSGGQQQRVALARALALEPRVLLLDEPLSNLDASLRETVRDDIRMLQRQLGITALLVTHDQVEAMSVSDRIAILCDGNIAQIDEPDVLYHRPSSQFVASFLGRANLLRGEAVDGVVRIGEACLQISTPVADGPVTVLARPEWFEVGQGHNGFSGQIRKAVLLGNVTRYDVEIPAFGSVIQVDRASVGAMLHGPIIVNLPPDRAVPLTS